LAKKKNKQNVQREMTHRQLSRYKRQQRRQRIIFFSGIGIIVAVILIIVGGWFAGEYMPLHQTVLQIYDTKFAASFFIDTMVIFGRSQGSTSLSDIASSVINQIIQNELIKQEAGKLGISVSDEEANQYLLSVSVPANDAAIELARGALLADRMRNKYFASQVPTSDNQVNINAMMVESASVAREVREKVLNGENFSELVDQYAVDAASKDVHGGYGEHPLSILKDKFVPTFPFDYISRTDIKTGDVSEPLSDNVSQKKLGYWLIRVNDRPTLNSTNISPTVSANEEGAQEYSVNVSAIFLGSQEEAITIRERLEAGEALGPIADQYSQYSIDNPNHGEMGLVAISQNVSDPFNQYVFDLSTELGKWSQPIRDDTFYYTKGGFWIVQVVNKEENKELTTDDRDTLIGNLYTKWTSSIVDTATPYTVNNITSELLSWAIEKATAILQSG
jgi:parvulin-like peptidyl-prolyl isomerase